ncbi:MAG: hypothetical protein E7629_04725 [Ruminococcaceae bacterium]|nr:hypothetical protein [Oscillospiraceae bacterium]
MKKQAKQIFWNALLLTAASLLIRTVSVSFQVYISNRAGAEAMGLFSLMSGVYGFALTLATSGIHLGVTRVISDAIGKKEDWKIPSAMRYATAYALGFGLLAMSLLIGFAEVIGTVWLKDLRTVRSLRLFGLTLPLIALSSAWGGYFTAVRRVYKNAAVQVWEQTVKIAFTMYLLAFMLPGGIESTCCALVLGGALAELCSFLLNLLLYFIDRRRHFPNRRGCSAPAEGKKLCGIALPIAMTTYVRSGLITLQHVLIPKGLRSSGASHAAALISYGSIHSMALPIILYPAALISSFSGLLVPTLAECAVKKETRRISYMISRVWSLSLLFSFGVAGILICFSEEFGQLLYPGTQTGHFIRILAPLIPIMYIDTATDAMMKGLGEQIFSMNVNIMDALISVILVWLLIPRYGIFGYLIAIYFSELFNTTLSIHRLLCISKTPVRLLKWVYKPLIGIVGATVLGKLLFTALPLPLCGGTVALHCLLVLMIYLALLLLLGGVEKEDLFWLRTVFQKEKKEKGL